MARRRAEDVAATREQLLTTGLRCIAREGFHGTAIRDITNAAGLPKGSFYNYFESKESFLGQVIERYIATLASVFSSPISEGQALLVLRGFFAGLAAFHRGDRFAQGCLLGNLAGELAPNDDSGWAALAAATATLKEHLARVIELAQNDGSVRDDVSAAKLGRFLWTVWTGAVLEAKVTNSETPLKECLELLFDTYLPRK